MLSVKEILSLRGLDTNAKIKLVRHQDKRYDLNLLYSMGQLEVYQSYQSKPIFNCDFIVSFIGMEHSKARLIGVYRVKGMKSGSDLPSLPKDFIYPDLISPSDLFYELEKAPGFEDINNRIVINWGKNPLAWHQWLIDKEVIEVLPTGYVKEFPGYLDFVLSYQELVTIINNPDANREWHKMLSAIAGIYLILDTKTGKQYVGSAYGEDGIIGRWGTYAHNPSGRNKLLKELLVNDVSYARYFQFTILQPLPNTLTPEEVIAHEVNYKKKLGSNAFGLNSN